MRPIARRTAALVAVPALSLAGLVVTSAPASAAADPAPAAAAGAWLHGQLTDGLVLSPYNDENGDPYPDYGLTIDAAMAFDAVGAPASVVEGISAAIAARVDDYVAPGFGTYVSTGSAAKAAVLAQLAGDDATSFGGRDLVADVEENVAEDGALAGRIHDDIDAGDPFATDYANVFGQAFAAQALDAAGSDATDAVTDFLLQQQCAGGYFRQAFADPAAEDQSCDGGDGKPNVDVTALAIGALQSQLDDTDVAAHVADAVAWLVGQQKSNGGFGSDRDIPTANGNSTGAAAYALLVSGETEAAAEAAAWLRAHQATNVANCVYYAAADLGAVVYDDATRTAAQAGPMDAELRYQSVRATTEALPGLLAAQAGPGEPNVLSAPGYVKAGGTTQVGVIDAAPGEPLCAMLGEQSVLGWANPRGEADLVLRLPKKAGTSTVEVANAAGTVGDAELVALGKAKLKVKVKKERIAAGAKQVITVKGLAPGETVSVSVKWPSRAGSGSGQGTFGQANGKGVAKVTVKVSNKRGAAKVKATGEFKNRKGATSFTVTR
jgi:hypothetical protein